MNIVLDLFIFLLHRTGLIIRSIKCHSNHTPSRIPLQKPIDFFLLDINRSQGNKITFFNMSHHPA